MGPADGREVTQFARRLPSDERILDSFVEQLDAYLSTRFDDSQFVYRVLLLASEAVTNGIKHGNRRDASKFVDVQVTVNERRIEVVVEDEGQGFDPTVVDDPLAEESRLRPCGRGIFLIRSMADDYEYELGGRRLRMAFEVPATSV
jgi:serine/threonine-protein kinase RsbW